MRVVKIPITAWASRFIQLVVDFQHFSFRMAMFGREFMLPSDTDHVATLNRRTAACPDNIGAVKTQGCVASATYASGGLHTNSARDGS